MSVWYQIDVTALAADKTAIAKFFGLNDSWEEVRTHSFEFSFSGKNAPSLSLRKIVQQNPDLVFLIKQSIEIDTEQWFITKFDAIANEHRFILIQDFGFVENKINKKILEAYTNEYPTLPPKHLENQKGFEGFRWRMFFNDFDMATLMLNQADQYQEMVPVQFKIDLDFDNDLPRFGQSGQYNDFGADPEFDNVELDDE